MRKTNGVDGNFPTTDCSDHTDTDMAQKIIDGVEALRGLVGQEVGVSDWFPVEQVRIAAFADATEDHQWIHLDVERARSEMPGGTTIAHGFLTLSLLSYLVSQAVEVKSEFSRLINYGFNRVRFTAPVPAGARIRARCALVAIGEVPGGVQVAWGVTVEVEGGTKPSLVAEWLTRYYQ